MIAPFVEIKGDLVDVCVEPFNLFVPLLNKNVVPQVIAGQK